MERSNPLSPEAVRRALPVSHEARLTVHAARQSLQAVREGYDKRSTLVIGVSFELPAATTPGQRIVVATRIPPS